MKRSRHRWMGLTVFCIAMILLATELPTSSALRATSLIFAKTTTTTTAAPEELPTGEEDGPQTETTGEGAEGNSTSKLTGIPQIDYLLDPNLPRELNGYNLSEYPFYETVPPPETMDFKCDGLHDGFYASVPHKCQVYHHCLFGTRYDFLCANYTAFDQKTFICHFVSEVDCKNSPNYFSRNEALYKATTSATPPPPPSTTSTTTTTTQRPQRPSRRRPVYRYDYYDDDYYYRDDYDYGERRRPRPRPGGRPGNKNRPADDYEDDRYERRPRPRDEATDDDFGERRPYNRRPGKRRPYADDEDRRPGYRAGSRRPRPRDDDDDRYRSDEEERPRGGKRDDIRPKKPRDDYRSRDEGKTRDELRPRDEDVPKNEKDGVRPRDEIRPREDSATRDSSRSKDEIRPRDESRSRDNIRPRDERRPSRDDVAEKPRASRPRDDRYQNEGRRYREDRPYRNRDDRPYSKGEKNYESDDKIQEEKKETPSAPEGQGLVKPNGHGLFSQPRMPPKIKRPVPINEKEKYDYVTVATTKAPPKFDDDEYYDYEEDDTSKPSSSGRSSTVQQRPKPEVVEKEKFRPSRTQASTNKGRKNKRPVEYEDEYYDEPVVKNEKYTNQRNKDERSKPKLDDDYYEDYLDKKTDKERPQREKVEPKVKNVRPNVRVVKRPFLPSRGGSPYLPRGLQPVAGRDVSAPISTTPKPTTTTTKPTTTTTTTTTTTKPPTTTKQTTTLATEIPTTNLKALEDEYEYYDEEDIDYDKNNKELVTPVPTTAKPQTTVKSETTTAELTTPEQKAKNLATKVLRVYNDNYEAIRGKLESTLSPGDYIKPYLATSIPYNQAITENYKPKIKVEVSKPYTATGKPVIPENISIKQNLADSIENEYDERYNEALAPALPVNRRPSGFIPAERDYTFSRFRSFQQAEPQFAASEISYQVRAPQVSLRTPSSFYLQPQRLIYQDEVARRPRQYRLSDFI